MISRVPIFSHNFNRSGINALWWNRNRSRKRHIGRLLRPAALYLFYDGVGVTSLLFLPFSFLVKMPFLSPPFGLSVEQFSAWTKLLFMRTVPLPAAIAFSWPEPLSSTKKSASPRSSSLPNVAWALTCTWNWVSPVQLHLKLSSNFTCPIGD